MRVMVHHLVQDVEVLVGDGPLGRHIPANRVIGEPLEVMVERGGIHDLAQNRGVRALRNAFHVAHAVLADEFGDVGGDVAEVAQGAGGSRHHAARRLIVGGRLV